jgi:hypothetical protein
MAQQANFDKFQNLVSFSKTIKKYFTIGKKIDITPCQNQREWIAPMSRVLLKQRPSI